MMFDKVRIPTAKASIKHKDAKKYNRKTKHKGADHGQG